MDFEAFEHLALRAYFETTEPLTSAYLAYATRMPSKLVERYLARMVETGTLAVRANPSGVVEYFVPGAKRQPRPEGVEAFLMPPVDPMAEPPLISNPLTAVCLSVLVPGAGHIYAGRPGAGVAWMASTLMGYACCFFPGVFLHGLCMLSAASNGARSGSSV